MEIGQGKVVQTETVGAGGDIEGGDRVGQAVGNQEVVEMEVEEGGDKGGNGQSQDKQGGRRFSKRDRTKKDFFYRCVSCKTASEEGDNMVRCDRFGVYVCRGCSKL